MRHMDQEGVHMSYFYISVYCNHREGIIKYTENSQIKRPHTLLTLKIRSITIYATCVKSYIADDQNSHIINQVPDFVHLRILSAFQNEKKVTVNVTIWMKRQL